MKPCSDRCQNRVPKLNISGGEGGPEGEFIRHGRLSVLTGVFQMRTLERLGSLENTNLSSNFFPSRGDSKPLRAGSAPTEGNYELSITSCEKISRIRKKRHAQLHLKSSRTTGSLPLHTFRKFIRAHLFSH